MKQLSFNEEDIQNDLQALSTVEIQHLADECQMALNMQFEEFENFKQQGFFKRIYNFISGNNTREISKHIRTVADIQKCALIVLNAILRQNKDIMLRISIHEQRICDLAENDNYLQGKINEINQRISEMDRDFIFLDIANKLNKTKLPDKKKSPYTLMLCSMILYYLKVLSSKKISPLSNKLTPAPEGVEDMICAVFNHVLPNYDELPDLTFRELNKHVKKELKHNNILLPDNDILPFAKGDFFEQLSCPEYEKYAWSKNPVGLLAYQCFDPNAFDSEQLCYSDEKISIVDHAKNLWYELVYAGKRTYYFDFEEKYKTLRCYSTDKSVNEITQQVLDLADNYKDLFFPRRQDILSSAVYLNPKILTAFLHASKSNENYKTLLTPEFTLHRGEPQIVKKVVYNKCNAPIKIKAKGILPSLPLLPPAVDYSSLISECIEAQANNFSIAVEQHYPVSELQYNGVAIDCEKAGIHCQEVESVVAFIKPVVIIKMDPEIEITQSSGNGFCATRKNEPGKTYEKSLIYYTLPL